MTTSTVAPVADKNAPTPLYFILDEVAVNLILDGLSHLPLRHVKGLFDMIEQSARQQLQAARDKAGAEAAGAPAGTPGTTEAPAPGKRKAKG